MVNNNNNLIVPKEKLAQVEEVREIENKYEVPSYEEFMKTYESDGNLNYDDLNGGNVGEAKGYGPCPGSDDEKKIAFWTNAISTGILTFICPPAGAAAAAFQATAGIIAKQSDDPQKKELGEAVSDAATVGLSLGGLSSSGGKTK